MRLLCRLKREGRQAEIAGVVLLSLGKKKPVSLGLIGKLPAFVLGELYSSRSVTHTKKLNAIVGFTSVLLISMLGVNIVLHGILYSAYILQV